MPATKKNTGAPTFLSTYQHKRSSVDTLLSTQIDQKMKSSKNYGENEHTPMLACYCAWHWSQSTILPGGIEACSCPGGKAAWVCSLGHTHAAGQSKHDTKGMQIKNECMND